MVFGIFSRFYESELAVPEKRSRNLTFARNVVMFVGAVVLIRKYGDLLLPPPAEALAQLVEMQNQQMMQMQQAAAAAAASGI
jgi:hypothetical protein